MGSCPTVSVPNERKEANGMRWILLTQLETPALRDTKDTCLSPLSSEGIFMYIGLRFKATCTLNAPLPPGSVDYWQDI